MEKNDEVMIDNKIKNSNNTTNPNPPNSNTQSIQSYVDKKYCPNFNKTKYSLKYKNIILETNFNKDKYPYHFKYNDSMGEDFLKCKKQKNTSEIIYTRNDNNNNSNNLNWYESFKKSKFYKECDTNKINEENKHEEKFENKKENLLQNKINEILNSFKEMNDINNKYSVEPYLIKNKYAELF